jgi:hypothetical protein
MLEVQWAYDNSEVQNTTVAFLNVKVWSIDPQEKQSTYSLLDPRKICVALAFVCMT